MLYTKVYPYKSVTKRTFSRDSKLLYTLYYIIWWYIVYNTYYIFLSRHFVQIPINQRSNYFLFTGLNIWAPQVPGNVFTRSMPKITWFPSRWCCYVVKIRRQKFAPSRMAGKNSFFYFINELLQLLTKITKINLKLKQTIRMIPTYIVPRPQNLIYCRILSFIIFGKQYFKLLPSMYTYFIQVFSHKSFEENHSKHLNELVEVWVCWVWVV